MLGNVLHHNYKSLSFIKVTKQEKEIARMKEQLSTVASEIEQMKDVSSSASETKAAKQAIPREISVSTDAPQSVGGLCLLSI